MFAFRRDWRAAERDTVEFPAAVAYRSRWVAEQRSAVFAVPRAVVPGKNVVLNREHWDFARLRVPKKSRRPLTSRLRGIAGQKPANLNVTKSTPVARSYVVRWYDLSTCVGRLRRWPVFNVPHEAVGGERHPSGWRQRKRCWKAARNSPAGGKRTMFIVAAPAESCSTTLNAVRCTSKTRRFRQTRIRLFGSRSTRWRRPRIDRSVPAMSATRHVIPTRFAWACSPYPCALRCLSLKRYCFPLTDLPP